MYIYLLCYCTGDYYESLPTPMISFLTEEAAKIMCDRCNEYQKTLPKAHSDVAYRAWEQSHPLKMALSHTPRWWEIVEIPLFFIE